MKQNKATTKKNNMKLRKTWNVHFQFESTYSRFLKKCLISEKEQQLNMKASQLRWMRYSEKKASNLFGFEMKWYININCVHFWDDEKIVRKQEQQQKQSSTAVHIPIKAYRFTCSVIVWVRRTIRENEIFQKRMWNKKSKATAECAIWKSRNLCNVPSGP